MRGAGRVGGKTGNTPRQQRANRDFDPFPFDIEVGELPVPPELIPINDEWSISDPFESVDPRDCSRFPASPYCGEIPIRFPGPPIGFNIEIRTNGCTTCIYTYPVVGWLMLTPTIVCKRDPNCPEDRDPPPDPRRNIQPPPKLNENVQPDAYKSPECAERESQINRNINWLNASAQQELNLATSPHAVSPVVDVEYKDINIISETRTEKVAFYTYTEEQINSGCIDYLFYVYPYIDNQGNTVSGRSVFHKMGDIRTANFLSVSGLKRFIYKDVLTGKIQRVSDWEPHSALIAYRNWKPANCCGMPTRPSIKPPPPPPPPINDDDDDRDRKKRKREGGDDMCCNECRDASDKTDRLIKELREIKKALGTGKLDKTLDAAVGIGDGSVTTILNLLARRIGTSRYPIEVPQSLLTGVGDNVLKVDSLTDFHYWFINQIDALVGEFPIEIEVKDIDPLKEGDQKKKISLPNIAEAIAETYGLTIKNSVNQELELNMLLRLAAEIIATKNGVIVAQDYARANATFLGYKGNYKARETVYNFDFASVNLDPKSNQPIIMEKLLKTNKGYVQGWENEDEETAASFFQKLMFAAGIIKAVFFRGKSLTKQLSKEASSMADDAKTSEKDWEKFLRQINNENSMYNAGFAEKPDIKEEPKDPRNP